MLKERALPLGVLCLAAILLLLGLSARSISRSEGRWAVIAREMIDTGDCLTPTINKVPYYDKPLLSYWAILPFAAIEGRVSEWSARMPSALAALATVLLIYLMGKKLFGRAEGLAAAALLATAAMFVSLGRTASADPLNMLAVWGVLWCYISGGAEGRPGWTTALYLTAGAGSFLKGPVAAAAAFAVIVLYSAAGVALRLRKDSFSGSNLQKALKAESRWIFSRGAALGIGAGAALFAALLLCPFLLSGDSGLMRLMWKENVIRFFEPFDHKDPVYSYVVYGAVYFAPWTLLFLAALFDAKAWPAGKGRRFTLLAAAGIFLFFTASGSRRSYYILPLVPAMALIAGNTLVRWARGVCSRSCRFVKPALWFVVLCALAAPPALVYLRFHPEILPPPTGWILAAISVVSVFVRNCLFGLGRLRRGKRFRKYVAQSPLQPDEEKIRQIGIPNGIEIGRVCHCQICGGRFRGQQCCVTAVHSRRQ